MVDFFIFFAITLIIFALGFCTKTAKPSSLWLLALLGVLTYRFYSIEAFLLSAVMLTIVYALKFACSIIIKRNKGEQKCLDSLDKTFSLTATLFIEIMFLAILKFNFKGLEFNLSFFKFAFLASLTTAFAVSAKPYLTYLIAPLMKRTSELKDGKFAFDVLISALLSLICGTATFAVTKTLLYSLLISLSSILSCFAVAYIVDYIENKNAKRQVAENQTAQAETATAESINDEDETENGNTEQNIEISTFKQAETDNSIDRNTVNHIVIESLAINNKSPEPIPIVEDAEIIEEVQPKKRAELENSSEIYCVATTFATMAVAIILALIIKY